MKILIFDSFEHEELFKDPNGKTCKYLFWRTSNSGKPAYLREKQMKSISGFWTTVLKSYSNDLNDKNWHSKLSDILI